MGSTVTASIPRAQTLCCTHKTTSVKYYAEVSRRLNEISMISITTTRVQPRGSPLRWYPAPSPRSTIKTEDRRNWQNQPRCRTTGSNDRKDREVTRRQHEIFLLKLIREWNSRQPHGQSWRRNATTDPKETVEGLNIFPHMNRGSIEYYPHRIHVHL